MGFNQIIDCITSGVINRSNMWGIIMGAKILDCRELFITRFRENVGRVPEWIFTEDTLDLETLKDQFVHGVYHDCPMVMGEFYKYCQRYLIDGDITDLEARLLAGLDLDVNGAEYYDGSFLKCFDVYRLDPETIECSLHDPFTWYDRKYKTTLRLLEIQQHPISIRTRSDLVAHDQYLEHIQVGSTVTFLVTQNMIDGGSRTEVEAGFPSLKRLQRAGIKLIEHGIKVQWEIV